MALFYTRNVFRSRVPSSLSNFFAKFGCGIISGCLWIDRIRHTRQLSLHQINQKRKMTFKWFNDMNRLILE